MATSAFARSHFFLKGFTSCCGKVASNASLNRAQWSRHSHAAGFEVSQLFTAGNGVSGWRRSNSRFFSDKKTTEESEQPQATEDQNEDASDNSEKEPQQEEQKEELSKEEQLEAQVKSLEDDVKELKDQLLRTAADAENTRTIAKRDVVSARQFAIEKFAKSLLDTSDNLTRAMEAVPEEARSDKDSNPSLVALFEGIDMTEKGLNKAFTSHGLVKYGKIGELFDPNKHNALFEYPDPEKKAGTVGQIIKTGFLLNDRVLRSAEVGVVKN